MLAIDQYKQELLYELGDAQDKQEKYDDAFSAYSQANQINKIEFDRHSTQKSFDAIKSTYTENSLKQLKSSRNPSTQPVFIYGAGELIHITIQ